MVQNGDSSEKSPSRASTTFPDAAVDEAPSNSVEKKSLSPKEGAVKSISMDNSEKTSGKKPIDVDKRETTPISRASKTPTSTTTTTTTTAAAESADDKFDGDANNDCDSDDCADLQNVNDNASDQSHNDPGKMFIGGLSWQTSAEGLRDYFCKFGDVNECMVMRDPATKRARGFGFITFADPASVEKVLAVEAHQLDGKKIDPKVAFPKRQQPKMVVKTKKVFIGGLSATSTLEDIKHYFQQYGKIEDAMLMFDKTTQRHRGFGFITFDDDDISDKVCEIHFHEINGKMVECKKAQPKEVMLPVQMNKSRAAAARNYYGIAPEQLLAYASYMPNMPRLGPYNNTGMLFPTTLFNGFPQSFGLSGASSRNTSGSHHGALNRGNSASGSALGGNGTGLINPRNLAAVQLAAQQQAVYEAAMAYATSMGSLSGSGGNSGATSSGGGASGTGGGECSTSGQLHPATVAAAAAAVAAAAAANQQPPHHQQTHHHPRQALHQQQVVVTTHHHHHPHAQVPPHHMHTVSAQQGHHHHQAQQPPPPLHHQHPAGGGMAASGLHQGHHLHHHQQQPLQGQQTHQRPPLLPGHYPPHKM